VIHKPGTLLIMILFCSCLAPAVYAEGGGFRINYNDFNLYLEFNDNISEHNDAVTGMGYIREPAGIFFDILSLIQANREVIAKSRQHIVIYPDNENGSISIDVSQQGDQASTQILDLQNQKHFDAAMILKHVCKAMKLEKCQPAEATWIYVSEKPLVGFQSDMIEFGCFPCNNAIIYTLTDHLVATDPGDKLPRLKKTIIDRKSINNYFTKVD